jgi:predicted nuclease of predicted toxin-antitoxin system
MKILADQDVYRLTVEQLKQWGHDVITAKELGLHKSPDEELLKAGNKTRRLLITRDKDFGSLIFLRTQESVGVILLRMGPKTVEKVHSELHRLFQEQDEEILKKSFCVVESKRYRIRRLDKRTKS